MKFCVNCKHYISIYLYGLNQCRRVIKPDVVHGTIVEHRTAYSERRKGWFVDRCGPEAKYWESKELLTPPGSIPLSRND